MLKSVVVVALCVTAFCAGVIVDAALVDQDKQQHKKDFADLADTAIELSVRLNQTERMIDNCIQSATTAEIESMQCGERLKRCVGVK